MLLLSSINDTGTPKQLNVEFEVEKTDRVYIYQLSMMAALIVYSRYPDYDQYMISFSGQRMPTGWIRYKQQDLADVCASHENIEKVWKRVVGNGECMIFQASTEDVDLLEAKYFCFPSIKTGKYSIRNVQDASLEDRKRLRAHLFVGQIKTRGELLTIIDEALEWLLQVKNPPSPVFPHKHGTMPADSIYMNVYKEDRRKDKNMFLTNENFICFVDYNQSGKTILAHGGVIESAWVQYHHETLGKKQIAWRDTTYYTRRVDKIGRNDLCPCGSGKKYKNCCLTKQ